MSLNNFSPYEIVKESLSGLRDNERKVITGRFGIDTGRKTLSAIGKDLKLSRERVRQIEKEGLKKIAGYVLVNRQDAINQIVEIFEKSGGVAAIHKLSGRFLDEAYRGDANQFNALNLIFFIMPQLKKIKKTRELEEGWILASLSREEAVKVINEWASHLQKVKAPQSLEILLKVHPHHSKYEMTFLSELPTISKKIVKTETGHIGLSSWSEINPRNIRDKIYYVLKKNGKPLHFEEITDRIKTQQFDRKKVVKATVHNELIADSRFILVGRGVYALKEWGYSNGTVSDIIRDILSGSASAMGTEEIIKEVLKQRLVKKNTVLINLKTRPEFKKVGEDSYSLV